MVDILLESFMINYKIVICFLLWLILTHTAKPGTYIGKFIIEFLDGSGTLIVPIREELIINVLEGSIKK
jgi:hypothetical protein